MTEHFSKDLTDRLKNRIIQLGEDLPSEHLGEDGSSKKSLLTEKKVKFDKFEAIFRPNEGNHAGCPHCQITIDEESATFCIKDGKILAGKLSKRESKVSKAVVEHSQLLMDEWNATRPDDQKLSNVDYSTGEDKNSKVK